MKRILVLTFMIAGLLLGGALWAIPPDTGEYELVNDEAFVGACGNEFDLCEAGAGLVVWKNFYFNNGDPKRYTEKVKFYGMVYQCGNPDNGLPYNPLSYTWGYDYTGDHWFVHGLLAMVTVPGYGQMFRDVGNFMYEFDEDGNLVVFFEAGEHQWLYEDVDAVCDYLMIGD